jgi:hypothetical protein
MKPFAWVAVGVSLGLGLLAASAAPQAVLTYHNDNARTGLNDSETVLTPDNVQTNGFGKIFSYAVDGAVYAQPLVMPNVAIAEHGTHNVVFVATEHDSVYAFDADANIASNAPLWMTSFLGPGVTPVSSVDVMCSNLTPEIGITSTPVIDPQSRALFVVAKTKEFSSGSIQYFYRLHSLEIGTGQEKPNSPIVIEASVPGTGDGSDSQGHLAFTPLMQLNRAALLLNRGAVYIAFGSHCDNTPQHGWVFAYNARTLAQLGVFCTTPDGDEGGIWHGGGGPAADSKGSIYVMSGNGTFDGIFNFGECFLKLSSPTLNVADFFTPYNTGYLSDNDLDLSGGVMLLPNSAGSPEHPHLLVGAGKTAALYMLDRDNLGKIGQTANDQIVQEVDFPVIGGAYDTPAYFNQTIYYVGARSALTALPIANGVINLSAATYGPFVFGFPGATPSVSSSGSDNGIIWTIDSHGFLSNGPAILRAYDAGDVTQELYNSSLRSGDKAGPAVKFTVPTIANGKVYVGGYGTLSVYGLRGGPVKGTYTGLFFDTNGITPQSSGRFVMTTTAKGRFTGRLQMGSTARYLRGQFDSTGAAQLNIQQRGSAPLTVQLQLDPDDSDEISGTVSDGTFNATLNGERAVFDPRKNITPQAGRYTLVFPGSADSTTAPGGDTCAAVLVNKTGRVSLNGTLADRTPFSQGTVVSKSGQLPLYSAPYGGQGEVLGWVALSSGASNSLNGSLTWIKPPNPRAKCYPGGFTIESTLTGSQYIPPATGSAIFSTPVKQLQLIGGDLSGDVDIPLVLISNTRAVNARSSATSSLNFSLGTGLFRGTVLEPGTRKLVTFTGAVLQDREVGRGWFILTDQSGRVLVAP